MTTISAYNIPVPVFDGDNYDYWSIRMKTYFQAQSLWDIVEIGFTTPKDVETLPADQQEKHNKNVVRNAAALGYIQQAMTPSIFPRIMGATTAKEAWRTLQEEFQGSTKVRSVKLLTLRRDFENLKMKDFETVKDYYSRIKEIVNQMRAYGDYITDKRIVEKILISMTEKYDHVITAIEESKDIETLSVTELVGSLEAYEARLSR